MLTSKVKVARMVFQITPATLEYQAPDYWCPTSVAVAELMAALPTTLERLAIPLGKEFAELLRWSQ